MTQDVVRRKAKLHCTVLVTMNHVLVGVGNLIIFKGKECHCEQFQMWWGRGGRVWPLWYCTSKLVFPQESVGRMDECVYLHNDGCKLIYC